MTRPAGERLGRGITLVLAWGLLGCGAGPADRPERGLELRKVGYYVSGKTEKSAAEMLTYDPVGQLLFVVNGPADRVDILDIRRPESPSSRSAIDLSAYGRSPTSVAYSDGRVAVAVPAAEVQRPGSVLFFRTDGTLLARAEVGALPDMVVFTPDGRRLLVANEGEPHDYCAPGLDHDPVGSVSIIDVDPDRLASGSVTVRTAGFEGFDPASLDPRIRITGPHASVAQDLEPEYVAVTADSRTAYVSLQENNAIAEVDIETAQVVRLLPLGVKDHRRAGEGLDPSDRDGGLHPGPWPVSGLYQPDAIAVVEAGGTGYLVTANEGDPRGYDCFEEEARVAELGLDTEVFADPSLAEESKLGRLHVARAGDQDGDGRLEQLQAFGGRSFSIWSLDGERLYDSGQQFEEHLAEAAASGHGSWARLDEASPQRGPEPDSLLVGRVGEGTYAFVGLERGLGVMIYDITDPRAPRFVRFLPTLEGIPLTSETDASELLGPEGLVLIPPGDSPTGEALLVAANESGSVALFAVAETP
jgi:hypothetical protein